MIFFSPITRCAHRLPHSNWQDCVPAVIPVEKLEQAESFRTSGHVFVPKRQVARGLEALAKHGEERIRPGLLANILRQLSVLEI
jgi:hypothetical protein